MNKLTNLALITLLLASSCSSSSNENPVEVSSFNEVLIDAVWSGDPEFGINTLIAECMQQNGYTVSIEKRENASGPVSSTQNIDVEEYVKSYGYGIVEQPIEDSSPSAAAAPLSNLFDDAYQALDPSERAGFSLALVGSENPYDSNATGGCMGQVGEQIRRPDVGYFDAIDLLSTYVNRLNADTRVVEARAEWAQCMAKAGFDGYSDSTEVVMDVIERLNSPDADPAKIQQFELLAAQADFDCAQNTFAVISQVEAELAPEFNKEASELLLADN